MKTAHNLQVWRRTAILGFIGLGTLVATVLATGAASTGSMVAATIHGDSSVAAASQAAPPASAQATQQQVAPVSASRAATTASVVVVIDGDTPATSASGTAPPAATQQQVATAPESPGSAATARVSGTTMPSRTATVSLKIMAMNLGLQSPIAGNWASLLPIWRSAGTKYGVPWEVLAAINKIESNDGTNLGPSTAGAVGWMQFMPATWAYYGSTPRGGAADPNNPIDAITSAARYLAASGAASNLPGAIYAYNHAWWYVDEVLTLARSYGYHDTAPVSATQSATG
ncbi:MAG: hypothetical protein EPN30_08010 [Actinomycetota bacterium]|nr:MAG: hypothetical protein EPN30_08010 [Actinomycetota bacterium]